MQNFKTTDSANLETLSVKMAFSHFISPNVFKNLFELLVFIMWSCDLVQKSLTAENLIVGPPKICSFGRPAVELISVCC